MAERLKTFSDEQAVSLAHERSSLRRAARALGVLQILACIMVLAMAPLEGYGLQVAGLAGAYLMLAAVRWALKTYADTSQVAIHVHLRDHSGTEKKLQSAVILISTKTSQTAMLHLARALSAKDVEVESVEPSDTFSLDTVQAAS